MIISAVIAILIAGGVYLVMQRGMVRIIIGTTLMSHGVNILLLAAGVGAWRADPIADRTEVADAADPLPQAFVLTAIVISMAATAVMLAMAALGRDDDTTSTEDTERAQREFRSLETRGRAAHHIDEQSPQARRRRLREEEY
ncbi:cation:proton antiporter subunit C [Corynebacterium variabile]|uniref:cation:proton antiporter subunit C n=1 Tax=Corynebacterium variabile TaxID=1727 RepID=UPI002896F912|nr:cation:proton antiporter subunit C [Corynebacterium variabile]